MFSHLKANLTRRRDPRSRHDFSRLDSSSVELIDAVSGPFHQTEEGRRNSNKPSDDVTQQAEEEPTLVAAGGALPEEREATRPGSGWWKERMLIDRSLCGMAALTSLFALIMLVICLAASPPFAHQVKQNPHSTSMVFQQGSCKSLESGYQSLKLLINVASTMILGMSNTYQQLVTVLRVDDLAYMLSKYGDCRVGTNSPFAIDYKRTGRLKSWLRWSLLIITSMPIHLLANSLVGTAVYLTSPKVTYEPVPDFRQWYEEPEDRYRYHISHDLCLTAFEYGSLVSLEAGQSSNFEDWEGYFGDTDMTTNTVNIYYDKDRCSESNKTKTESCTCGGIDCIMAYDSEAAADCALVLRMQPALILTGCLLAKAIYIVLTIYAARGHIKSRLLNFGDVLVVSSMYPRLQVHGEYMTSKGDFHRRLIKHTCHKHCKEPEPPDTGEELGHCQECKKFNDLYNHTKLPWPTLAMKRKRAFLGTLGQTALTHILLLCLLSMVSLTFSILFGMAAISMWHRTYMSRYPRTPYVSLVAFLNKSWPLTDLSINRISSEIASYLFSNGLQFVYSTIYLLLIYNLTLISMEFNWGKLEKYGGRLRCTIVKAPRSFSQSYLLQLRKRVLFPTMAYSAIMHWVLGLFVQAEEAIFKTEFLFFTKYTVTYIPNGLFGSTAMLIIMTITCWRTFSHRREGFIPQMYGSIRVLCASTTRLDDFNDDGIVKWGDLDQGELFCRAGLSSGPVGKIIPNELYC